MLYYRKLTSSLTDTVSYCGPFEYSNGSLRRVNFPGGYVSGGKVRHETPHLSSYLYCAANPVMLVDPTGMEITQMIDGKLYMYKKIDEKWGFYDFKNNLYTGDKSFAGDLDKIRNADPILDRMITYIAENETEVRLSYGTNNKARQFVDSQGKIDYYSVEYNPERTEGGEAINSDGSMTNFRSPEAGLAHELGHIFDRMNPVSTDMIYQKHLNLLIRGRKGLHREAVSCVVENIYREAIGEPLRIHIKLI